ncbi:MAG: glycosyltransferase family 2 protein [Deltaproteobacteria bacterium]|nr:glycosyltransferase family 2 protein [Deltaproteobacteria bacterium]
MLVIFVFIYAVTEAGDYYFGRRSLFISISITMLIFFLLFLILRYFFLLWFSFVQHIETVSDQDDVGWEPWVSIIVPAYNEEKVIERSIRSLLDQNYRHFEIIVVDDGSRDRTSEVAQKLVGTYGRTMVKVIRQPNRGKAAALNMGISVARGEFVLCVDADSNLHPLSIRRMVRHFRDEKVASVAGNVKVRNRVNLWTRLQALEYIEGLNMVRQAQGFFRSVNIIPGPIGMFRKAVLLEVGGYEHDTFAEDADLTLKIVTAGYHVRYEPGAISYTEAPETLQQLLKQRYRWTRGILQSMKKRPEDFLQPWKNFTTFFILWYMIFEAILWPAMNIFANVFLIGMNVAYGFMGLLLFWFLQLTVLDVVAAIHCVAVEEEDLKLVPYAVVYRIFFILVIDVCKVFATLEEVAGVKMGWGKLVRTGTE